MSKKKRIRVTLKQIILNSPAVTIEDENTRKEVIRTFTDLMTSVNQVLRQGNLPIRIDLRGEFKDERGEDPDTGERWESPAEEGYFRVRLRARSDAINDKPLTDCKWCGGWGLSVDPDTASTTECRECNASELLRKRDTMFNVL